MRKFTYIFISFLLVSLGLPSSAKKVKFFAPEYNLKEKKFITVSPTIKRRNDLVNFGRINFTHLDDDIVQTKLVKSNLVDNPYLKIKKELSDVDKNSSRHVLKFSKEVEESIAYLILETYTLENNQLKLKEQIPIRLDIGLAPKGVSCTAQFSCGKFAFPDIEVVGFVDCFSGGALVEIVNEQECD